MDIREKLVELQKEAIREFVGLVSDVPLTDFVADHLIANGVTIKEPVFLTGLTTVTDTPPVKYAPVKYGRWVADKRLPWKAFCSVCHHSRPRKNDHEFSSDTNYCPTCGAKMALEVGND